MAGQKGLVLITYRDRATHLECLIGQLQRHWSYLDIAVVEQADNNIWNKGLLYNIGYKLLAQDYDYLILHDVDFIPRADVDYSPAELPALLATECSQFNYQHCYDRFFGGVVTCSKEHYELVNGFSNKFRGWGGEDDNFYNSFIQKGIQPQKRLGNRFENFVHPRLDVLGKDRNNPDYLHNLQLAISSRDFSDGLSNCEDYLEKHIIDDIEPFHVIELSTIHNCKHIKVHTRA